MSLEIIPVEESRAKEWCEFEGASTYEYAHAQVRALRIASAK